MLIYLMSGIYAFAQVVIPLQADLRVAEPRRGAGLKQRKNGFGTWINGTATFRVQRFLSNF